VGCALDFDGSFSEMEASRGVWGRRQFIKLDWRELDRIKGYVFMGGAKGMPLYAMEYPCFGSKNKYIYIYV
jgi:hypothetical protein